LTKGDRFLPFCDNGGTADIATEDPKSDPKLHTATDPRLARGIHRPILGEVIEHHLHRTLTRLDRAMPDVITILHT
jgi:hypothetical protein